MRWGKYKDFCLWTLKGGVKLFWVEDPFIINAPKRDKSTLTASNFNKVLIDRPKGFKHDYLVTLAEERADVACKRSTGTLSNQNLAHRFEVSVETFAIFLGNFGDQVFVSENATVLVVSLVYSIKHGVTKKFRWCPLWSSLAKWDTVVLLPDSRKFEPFTHSVLKLCWLRRQKILKCLWFTFHL